MNAEPGLLRLLESYLPITVAVSLLLFFAKEGLEATRRWKANRRKRQAIRRLIADEVERNNWAIDQLRDCVKSITDPIANDYLTATIRQSEYGRQVLRFDLKGKLHSESPLPEVHKKELSTYLLDLALIDGKVFPLALNGLGALKELDHLVKSLTETVSDSFVSNFKNGFREYVEAELLDIESSLAALYMAITGQKLKSKRMR